MSVLTTFLSHAVCAAAGAAGSFFTQGVLLMKTVADLSTEVTALKAALAAHLAKDTESAAKIVDLQTQLDAFKTDATVIDSAATDIASVSAALNPVPVVPAA